MKILIADDHALIREGVKHTVLNIFPQATVIEAEKGSEVVGLLEESAAFDIVLLDLVMPDVNGFDLLTLLCDKFSEIPIIILSATEDQSIVKKALDIGASGFIPKSTNYDIMLNALNLVLSGGVYIPPQLLLSKNKSLNSTNSVSSLFGVDLPSDISEASLSVRQLDVLKLMAKGLANKRIAAELGLSENTVKIHVTAILKTLNVSNRTEAVIAAQNNGLA